MIGIEIPNPKKVFAPVYYPIRDAKTRFIINYGGTGSGKSYASAQNEVLQSAQNKINTLVIRKVGSTLRDSVIPSFKTRISEFDLWEIFSYNKSDQELTCTQTGSVIKFRGLDDPEKMKSFEGLTRIMIEEASELEFEDFLEVNRRVRGMPNIKITLNFNPIHENHWLKKHFFDGKLPKTTIIKSTYQANPFLLTEDKEQIEWLRNYNYNQYRIYALGDWGLTENGNPWLFAFDRDKHVKSLPFLPTYHVYLSFDFNREPISCLAAQMSPERGTAISFVHFIREFSENIQLEELCNRIKAAFPNNILHVTGDASGNAGDAGFEKRNTSYYKMIQSYLGLSDSRMDLFSKNMEHNDSRNLCNTMLYNLPNVFIDPSCKVLINDCQIATVDEDVKKGGMLKKDRDEFKMDMFDAFRYFWQCYFSDYIDKVRLLKK